MVRVISSSIGSILLWAILVFDSLLKVSGNAEGDALNALKNNLADPNNVLQSWDATEANLCMWFRVTCNSDNKVIRLDLGDEDLTGQLVPQLGQLQNLQYLELYSNNISGKIPDELGNLTNLVSLDLSFNRLTGPIPDTLANLKRLRFLRLHNNSLSGNIPVSLTTVASLQVIDFSNNQLEGDLPINGSFSLFAPISFSNNPGLKLSEFPPPPPISPMPPASSRSLMLVPPPIFLMPPAPSGNNATTIIAGGVAAGTTALWFAAYAIAFFYWRRRKLQDHYFDVPDEEEFNKIPREQLKRFSLIDLQVATDNFSFQNRVGQGGFALVYKGRLADGSLIAVKRIERGHLEHMDRQFQTEMKMRSMAVHHNLLRLNGFCITTTEWLLVYPFMINRSVDWFLRDRPKSQPPLDWPKRKCIALGAARGLAYLHHHCDLKIIHRDIKASNILLDEKFEAVIGDFGLAKFIGHKDTHVNTAVIGTVGHVAPEYLLTGTLTEKTDVFGYGAMLLELITGHTASYLARLAKDDDVMLLDWVKGLLRNRRLEILVDADLQGNHNEKEVEQLIQVSLLCTQHDHLRRPKMSEVVSMLEDDDFSEKWEQYFQNELFLLEFDSSTSNDYNYWESHSASFIPPEELSGPG